MVQVSKMGTVAHRQRKQWVVAVKMKILLIGNIMEDEGTLLDKVGGPMNVCGPDMWKNISCILG